MINVPMRVLIAEDDENDALLIQRAIQKVNPAATYYVVHDGAEAIAYLRGDGRYANRQKFHFPRVLITDLKMPKMDGFQVLAWLHQHPECNIIPKIVLSASNLTADVIKAYQLGANAFFCKPPNLDRLIQLVELHFRYWSEAELPPDSIQKCA
jgi:CheY-like chemotaxis protein